MVKANRFMEKQHERPNDNGKASCLYNKRARPRKIQEQKKKNPQQQHFGREFFRGNFLTEFF